MLAQNEKIKRLFGNTNLVIVSHLPQVGTSAISSATHSPEKWTNKRLVKCLWEADLH